MQSESKSHARLQGTWFGLPQRTMSGVILTHLITQRTNNVNMNATPTTQGKLDEDTLLRGGEGNGEARRRGPYLARGTLGGREPQHPNPQNPSNRGREKRRKR